MQIHYQLAMIKKSGSLISNYFQKFKGLVDALVAAGQPFNDFEIVSYLLVGLGAEYDPFVMFVTTRVDPLSIDKLYSHLLAHENHLEQHHNVAVKAFPLANLASKSQPSCGRGSRGSPPLSSGRNNFASSRGHHGRGRGGCTTSYPSTWPHPSRPSSRTTRPTCQVCNKMGHTALQCYNWFNHAYHGESLSSQLAAFVAGSLSFADYNWYPDTGATNHLTSDLSNLNLQSEEYVGTSQIHVGNGAVLAITHIGSSSLPSSSKSFTLQNVLHVPHITKNLISVSQFTKDNDCFLNFIRTFFVSRIELQDTSSIAGRVKLDSTPFSHLLPDIINVLLLLENVHPSLLGMVALDTLPSPFKLTGVVSFKN